MVFTLDHWYALMAEMISVPEISTPLCYVYIVLWLLIASFTFRNIVLGVMGGSPARSAGFVQLSTEGLAGTLLEPES